MLRPPCFSSLKPVPAYPSISPVRDRIWTPHVLELVPGGDNRLSTGGSRVVLLFVVFLFLGIHKLIELYDYGLSVFNNESEKFPEMAQKAQNSIWKLPYILDLNENLPNDRFYVEIDILEEIEILELKISDFIG